MCCYIICSAPTYGGVNVTGGTKMYTGTVKWFDAKKGYGSLPAMMVKETFSFTSQQLKETDSSHWTKAIRSNLKSLMVQKVLRQPKS